ncbi:MAG: helix-turn-helix transcriptional regulator [Defluviitaleaceae bacterium]|nr:helix-turn-helix transcriptional regulator [Defluviitaleaceae bacterium]
MPGKRDPFDYTLSQIEGKWKLKIVYTLANSELMRYSELQRALNPITHKMLSAQLKELERDGIVVRTEYRQIPPRVEYSLSHKGEDMIAIFKEMWIWGHKYKG